MQGKKERCGDVLFFLSLRQQKLRPHRVPYPESKMKEEKQEGGGEQIQL